MKISVDWESMASTFWDALKFPLLIAMATPALAVSLVLWDTGRLNMDWAFFGQFLAFKGVLVVCFVAVIFGIMTAAMFLKALWASFAFKAISSASPTAHPASAADLPNAELALSGTLLGSAEQG
jgi:hypothetical protein